jgi:DNA-binding transcriptional ArsR family regulator
MVVRRDESEESLNQLFRALADGTRRDILARSLTETLSVSDLAARYEMSFAAVQKHVAVLERADLVTKHRHGRDRIVRGRIDVLRDVNRLLDELETIWRERMQRFREVLAEPDKENP